MVGTEEGALERVTQSYLDCRLVCGCTLEMYILAVCLLVSQAFALHYGPPTIHNISTNVVALDTTTGYILTGDNTTLTIWDANMTKIHAITLGCAIDTIQTSPLALVAVCGDRFHVMTSNATYNFTAETDGLLMLDDKHELLVIARRSKCQTEIVYLHYDGRASSSYVLPFILWAAVINSTTGEFFFSTFVSGYCDRYTYLAVANIEGLVTLINTSRAYPPPVLAIDSRSNLYAASWNLEVYQSNGTLLRSVNFTEYAPVEIGLYSSYVSVLGVGPAGCKVYFLDPKGNAVVILDLWGNESYDMQLDTNTGVLVVSTSKEIRVWSLE